MKKSIVKKVEEKLSFPDLAEFLADKISFSELQSLLIEVYNQKTITLKEKDLFANYKRSKYVQPSIIDYNDYLKLDARILECIPPGFQVLELSLVVPIGTTSIITPLSQNNVLSTVRSLEVISDSTNLLALESAKRREEILANQPRSDQKVKLCASQRLVRTQPFEDENFTAHFKVFALCTAGKDEGNYAFETAVLEEHLNFYIELLHKIIPQNKAFGLKLKLFLYEDLNQSIYNLIEDISARKKIEYIIDEKSDFGKSYYRQLRFMINITTSDNQSYDIVDGGFTNWTARLLNNKKERLLTSGIGTELLLKLIS